MRSLPGIRKFISLFLPILFFGILFSGCSAHEEISIMPHLCNNTLCNGIISGLILDAKKSVDCAFYSLSSKDVITAIDKANSRLNVRMVTHKDIKRSYSKTAKTSGLMHNKFCIIDGQKVISGSFNPGTDDEENSIVVIGSKEISSRFSAEFEELWTGIFGKGMKSPPSNSNIIRVFFCPEDDCSAKLVGEINNAKREINFLYYSFTLGEAAIAILDRQMNGVEIKGVFEKSQLSNYSMYWLLKYQGLDVSYEGTKMLLHHKLMVIDNKTVLIGSFNPTQNAQQRNDENLMIIKDRKIAQEFSREINSVFNKIR